VRFNAVGIKRSARAEVNSDRLLIRHVASDIILATRINERTGFSDR
jgi:hypothetical protein